MSQHQSSLVSDLRNAAINRTITPLLKQLLVKNALSGILILSLVFILFPLYWMLLTAIQPESVILSTNTPLLPQTFTTKHLNVLLAQTQFITYYINSILISIGVVTVTVVLSTLGGYGLTRIDLPYKRSFARFILLGYMFPPILFAIPLYLIWRQLGFLNTYVGLILALSGLALPFALWLMWQYFQTIPISMEESAQLAGASRFRAFYEITLPNAVPGIIAVAVWAYSLAWNAYTVPTVIMSDASMWPLTVGIDSFVHQHQVMWGQVMMASALAIVPSFLFVYFLQKYLLRGFRNVGDM